MADLVSCRDSAQGVSMIAPSAECLPPSSVDPDTSLTRVFIFHYLLFLRLSSIIALLYKGVRYHLAAVDGADDHQKRATHHNKAQRSCRLVPFVVCNDMSASSQTANNPREQSFIHTSECLLYFVEYQVHQRIVPLENASDYPGISKPNAAAGGEFTRPRAPR